LPCIGHTLIAEIIDSNTETVTSFHGGSDWHVCRVGLIISTIAYTVLCNSSPLLSEDEIRFIQSIGVPTMSHGTIDIPEENELC
jgi:hypothetical protein